MLLFWDFGATQMSYLLTYLLSLVKEHRLNHYDDVDDDDDDDVDDDDDDMLRREAAKWMVQQFLTSASAEKLATSWYYHM